MMRWTVNKLLRIAHTLTRIMVVISAMTSVIGTALIVFVDVESVIGSGPATGLFGSLLLTTSLICRNWYAAALALSMWFIAGLFFGLVQALEWSPGDAELPFAVMGVIYVVLSLPLAVIALLHRPACVHRSPWECQRCGYLLYGLIEPRCPECGTAFDAADVPAAPSMNLPHA